MKYLNFLIYVVLFSSCLFGGYAELVLEDAPIAWWRLNDKYYNHGCEAEEFTGNIQSSVFQDDVMIAQGGIEGRCGWFNGNKAGVDIGNCLGQLLDGSSAITFEAWIRCSEVPLNNLTQRIFAKRIDGGRAGLDIGLFSRTNEPSSIRIGARSQADDPYLTVSAPFSVAQRWVYLVCVIDFADKQISIYLDGILQKQADVDFSSDVYVLGEPAQTDQIGRTADITGGFRGYIDEIAIYNKALSTDRITARYKAGLPAEPKGLQFDLIAQDHSRMVHSPSMHIFDDGVILASYYSRGHTTVKISEDRGKTWSKQAEISGIQFASMFEHKGDVYLLGISRNPGHICITKTDDRGATWSELQIIKEAKEHGVLGYHTGPVPIAKANGRIYRVFEERVSTRRWPMAYEAVVFSADENSDLLSAESWRRSNGIKFDVSWVDQSWQCTSPGWLEGNVVAMPNGQMRVLMRVHTNPVVDKAAILTLTPDGRRLNYNPRIGLIDMPGGMHKFHIRQDPVTGKYFTLNNNNTDPSRPAQRNTLSLVVSDDLINWRYIKTIIQDKSDMTWRDSLLKIGFQYVVWRFDGDDIVFVSRTAYDGAPNYHDSNMITFHRVENYLELLTICSN